MAQSTTNYKLFKELVGNRSINKPHATGLQRAIAVNPEFLKNRPILVNEKMEVIDGQHRLYAATALQVPIYYEVQDGLGIKDAITLNLNQRNWLLDDYITSFAEQKIPAYVALSDLRKEYLNLSSSVIVTLTYTGSAKSSGNPVRNGTFTMIPESEATEILDQISDISALIPGRVNVSMARAIRILIQSENYDHDRMLHKLSSYGDALYRSFRAVPDICRNFEEIYNFNSRGNTVVRLF